jgi:hypothetical protein
MINDKMKAKIILLGCVILFLVTSGKAQEVPELDWDALQKTMPWKKSEQWEPVPAKVHTGFLTAPPSDAMVLFDGSDLKHWHKPKYGYGARMDQVEAIIAAKTKYPQHSEPLWKVKDGALIVEPGSGALETKQSFGDIQLHIEWLAPEDPGKTSQGYSNSGIFLMGLYEIQVLNSYENTTYSNGQAGAFYKQAMPDVNASRPPGEWQCYDIMFYAPRFEENGSLISPARAAVLHKGVLIHHNVELQGPCVFIGEPYYIPHPEKLPLLLQDHGDKVRFRNIWVREL